MQFVATRTEPDGNYSETLEARDRAEADRICAAKGWTLEGEVMATIPADKTTRAEMDALIERRNANRYDA